MNCPVCGDHLREIEKFSVRVDICPGCKGVWLDRGELDKVVELAARPGDLEAREVRHVEHQQPPMTRTAHYYPEQHHVPHHKKHKKSHWLGELFEFGDD